MLATKQKVSQAALTFTLGLLVSCSGEENLEQFREWQSVTSKEAKQHLTGIWRNNVLGHVAVFANDEVTLFHQLDQYCIADTGVIPPFSIYRHAAAADKTQFSYYDYRNHPALLQNHLEYVRLADLPEPCQRLSEVESAELLDVFDTAWLLFDRYYGFFDERGVDWAAARARYRPRAAQLKTDSELFDLLVEMLGELNDSHVNLTWRDKHFNAGRPRLRTRLRQIWERGDQQLSEGAFVGNWASSVQRSIVELIDPGTYASGANGALEWGIIGKDMGYVRINRFSSFTVDPESRQNQLATFRGALTRAGDSLQSTRRMIVDVSHNGGGNDAAAMTAVAAFMNDPRDVMEYSAPGSKPRIIRLSPASVFDQQKIVLVTSEITASAAEAFVLMMRALPKVEHVGSSTRGALSGLLPKPLPRGFRVTISYQTVKDAEGQLYEGIGVPPQRSVELFSDQDLFGSYRDAIAKLAADQSE
ncbi:MAG: S41 family peptidase [Pseudomonadota bacterium]